MPVGLYPVDRAWHLSIQSRPQHEVQSAQLEFPSKLWFMSMVQFGQNQVAWTLSIFSMLDSPKRECGSASSLHLGALGYVCDLLACSRLFSHPTCVWTPSGKEAFSCLSLFQLFGLFQLISLIQYLLSPFLKFT